MTFRIVILRWAWVLAAAGLTWAHAQAPVSGVRTFTDVFGRSVEAEIVRLDEETIGLRRQPDGSEFTLPLDRLSDADRDYLKENRDRITGWLTPLPETKFTTDVRRDFRMLKRSGLALEPVPPSLWTKTKYFVIIYGLPDSPEMSVVLKHIGEEMARSVAGKPVGVLWLGPSNPNGDKPPPIPAGDLKVAQVLPPGVAIVGVEAVARDRALVDAAIMAIARDESPEDPRLFFQTNYHARHEAVRAVWRKRIMAEIAVYWPGCVYRGAFDRRGATGVIQAFVVDREGVQAVSAEGKPLEGYAADMLRAAAGLTSEPK